jgi:hypothetical protein
VGAQRLTTLLTRPLGVAGATNPEAARGGQDPEELRLARENAPLTMLTLGRAVSVRDYEDFSRAFPGVEKAHAAWIAAGPGRGVLVTIAGAGAAIATTDVTYANLLGSLRAFGDATLPLRLTTYREARFHLRVAVKVHPDAETALVLARAGDALRMAFGFHARGFGQMVSLDEVAAVLHGLEGVLAVNVKALYRPDQGTTPRVDPRLFARVPETSLTAAPQAAELLVLDAATLVVEATS